MRLLILFLGLCVFITAPASAQDMLRDHRSQDPTARLLDEDFQEPSTIEDYATLYFESCTGSAASESMKEYVELQCGCTAAEMPKFMNLSNMKTLFTKTKAGDFQQARVLLLGYIPCLYNSVYDFVFDGCYYRKDMRRMIRAKKVCECYGHKMGDHVSKHGQNFVPGFKRNNFNSENSVPDPLTYIVSSDFFDRRAKYEFEQCVMTEAYGWNK